MDTSSTDDVNGESTNKAKDSETAQSTMSTRNVSTSTPLVWEDTLPAEVPFSFLCDHATLYDLEEDS